MTKIKINSQRAEVSSEEIKNRRDFNAVLKQHKTVSKPFYKTSYFLAGTTLLVAAGIITSLYVSNGLPEKTTSIIPDTIQPTQVRKFIVPAFTNLSIAYEEFSVASEKGGTLKLKNGSVIKIPASAFMNENREPISGKVNIRYREFRDAVDMLVAGIPMQYDSAGKAQQLESAGMFEILGFQNGKNVLLQKNITVEMASSNPAGNFNQYYLDTLAKAWKYLGRDKMVYTVKNNQASTNDSTRNSVKDFSNVIAAQETYEVPDQSLGQEINELKKEEPVKPTRAKFQNYRFNLDVLPEEFPELTDYKGLQFEVGPENKTFSEKLYSVEWDDVRLNYNTPGKNYKITFVNDSKLSEFIVYPVYQAKDSIKVMALYQKKFALYEKNLAQRITEEKKAKEQLSLQQKKYEEARILEEKKYAEAELKRSQAINYSNIRNVFAVSKFGTYNSDCPFTYDNQVSLIISFADEDNHVLPVGTAYMIDHQRNSLFAHYYNNSKGYRFNYNPESKNVLFTVTPQNELFVFSAEEFKNITPVNGTYVFKMKKSEKAFSNVKELKEFLLPQAN